MILGEAITEKFVFYLENQADVNRGQNFIFSPFFIQNRKKLNPF